MKRTYFTICSANYLAYARTLHASLKAADPVAAESFILFLVDEALPETAEAENDFKVILAKELNIPEFWDMAFRYSVMEFNTAVKPFCIQYIFDELGSGAAIYLDPDIYILSPLDAVHSALGANADIVLTPHIASPLLDKKNPSDVTFMQTGIYNLGFGAFANSPSGRSLVDWWAGQLKTNCRVDLKNGIFVDQKFMDMAPAFVEKCAIIRHPGYNIAYWNLLNRKVVKRDNAYFANGEPISFFHFSGVVPGDDTIFSKHQNRFEPKDLDDSIDLFKHYLSQLEEMGHSGFQDIPYAYNQFTDGRKIPDLLRKIYTRSQPSSAQKRAIVFSPDVEWANSPAKTLKGRLGINATLVLEEIWNARPDLKTTFAAQTDHGFEQYCRWFVVSAQSEYDLPDCLITPVKDALDRLDQSRSGGSRSALRWAARKAIGATPIFRGLYRRLPQSLRVRLRDRLVSVATGAEATVDNRLQTRGRLNASIPSGISVIGYLNSVSGVGEGGRRAVECLKAVGVPTSSRAIEAAQDNGPTITKSANAELLRTALFHVNADQTEHILSHIPQLDLAGRYRIGYWAWELAEFPDAWSNAFDYLDEIWVCSNFVKAAVEAKTEKPVHVVPHAVPDYSQLAASRAEFGLPSDRVLFLCTFDLNSYATRKNPGDAYKAFKLAIADNANDTPMLVVKTHGSLTRNEAWKSLVDELEDDPNVVMIDVPMNETRYRKLQMCCDALISLHRSEGFGMNIAEFMALGKPVIATAYGGNTDYMTEENSYLVGFDLAPLAKTDYIYGEGQSWAKPDLEQAASMMQDVAAKSPESITKAERGKATIKSQLSQNVVGQLMRQHLQRIDTYFDKNADRSEG